MFAMATSFDTDSSRINDITELIKRHLNHLSQICTIVNVEFADSSNQRVEEIFTITSGASEVND